MSPYSIVRLSVSTILAFSCTALQVLKEGQSRDLEERTSKPLPAPAQGLAMTSPANLFTESNDIDNSLYIQCDTASGTGLTKESCNNVLQLSPTNARMETWGYPDELPPGIAVDEDLPLTLWSGKETGIALMEFMACGFPSMLT